MRKLPVTQTRYLLAVSRIPIVLGLCFIPLGACDASSGQSAARNVVATQAPAGTVTAPTGTVAPPADWNAQWDRTLALAKQEGTLVINLMPGAVFRQWVGGFERKYPEIKLEVQSLQGSDFVARVLPERQAGQSLWDVHLGGPESVNGGLKPAGALEPLLPALILPEVLDDSKWLGGFRAGFTDNEGLYTYSMMAHLQDMVFVNRDVIPEAQLSRVEDLVDPKWKGKLSSFDARMAGKGSADAGHWVMIKGEDWWRSVLAQAPVVTSDRRQQIEWLVRGQYPIAISASNVSLPDFWSQGLGLSVKPLARGTDMGQRLSMSSVFVLLTNAPHPNAAKVFANWVLTQEAQQAYVKLLEQNSRRLDVDKLPDEAPDPTKQYAPSINLEKNGSFQARALAIAKEVIK